MTGPDNVRIGVDGFNLAMPGGTGVATYGRTLIDALAGMGRRIDLVYGLDVAASASAALRETLFFAALAEGYSGGEPSGAETHWVRLRRLYLRRSPRDLIEIPATGRVVRQGIGGRVPGCDRLFTFPHLFYLGRRYLRRHGRLLPVRVPDPPAIMHWTYPVPVRMIGTRNVYTVHDLVPLRLPFLSLEDKSYHELLLIACARAAAHIVTVSDVSRQDILDWLPVSPDAVTTLYQAVPERFDRSVAPATLAHRLRTLFDLAPQGYFLFYGATEPKKNVGRLIEAYLSTAIDRPLVIAGPEGWRADDAFRLSSGGQGAALSAADRIRRIAYLPTEHLDILVRGARALVFPSLYEGFGLPMVEAMQAGVPVIAGRAGALPEIAGDAALLVDPYDVEALAEALDRVDRDALLRDRLIAAGRARGATFAMQAYRSRLATVHDRVSDLPVTSERGIFPWHRAGSTMPALPGDPT